MEELSKINKKNWIKEYWFIALMMVIGISGLTLDIYYTYLDGRDKDLLVKEAQTTLEKERAQKISCVYTRDSLTRENARLSIYKSLSLAMVHRDEATSLLKYKGGDIVHMKIDSSTVIITDVIIGGSTHSYYIKYKIRYKDNSTEDIDPNLIY